ncbi:MAG: hypothetical protein ACKVOA_03285 [Methylophilaceae bacterium]
MNMNKLLFILITLLLSLGMSVNAAENSALPEISAYDDAAYDPLPDEVSSEFDGLTTEVSLANATLPEMTETSDNGGLPDLPATEEEVYEALPALVPNK